MDFTFEPISDEFTQDMIEKSKGPNVVYGELVVSPSGCVLPLIFKDYFERIRNFKVFPDDTWVITFPKCGTTWTQEMVWLLKNNLDFEKAKSTLLLFRVPFLEYEALLSRVENPEYFPKSLDLAENLSRPRCIKSHLPIELLPKEIWTVKPKIIHVVRDPKDVIISYYHHNRLSNQYEGTLEDFARVFLADRVLYAPFWTHFLGFKNLKDKSHILYNTFEEMKKDLAGVIRKTAKFLDVEVTDEQVEKLQEHLSFKSMKQNKSVNCLNLKEFVTKESTIDEDLSFIRKGESGMWKNDLSAETLEKISKWNKDYLKDEPYKDYQLI